MALPGLPGLPGQNLNTSTNIDTLPGITQFAATYGYQPPQEHLSLIQKASKAINYFSSREAGFVSGLIHPDRGITNEINRYVTKNLSFTDLAKREIKPTTLAGKVGTFALGLSADILFDPITYLSFGTAGEGKVIAATVGKQVWKTAASGIGGEFVDEMVKQEFKTTSKVGKLMDDVSAQRTVSIEKTLLADGVEPEVAKRWASKEANTQINQMVSSAIAKNGGLTQEAFDRLLAQGVSRNTLEELQALGPKLIDRGGLNLFGQRLVNSDILKGTAVGNAIEKLYYKGGLGAITHSITTPIAKAFVYGFQQNPAILRIKELMPIAKQNQINVFNKELEGIFKGLTDEEAHKIGGDALISKFETNKRAEEIQNGLIEQIKQINPRFAHDLASSKNKGAVLAAVEGYQGEVIKPILKRLNEIASEDTWATTKSQDLGKKLETVRADLAAARKKLNEGHDTFVEKLSKKMRPDIEEPFVKADEQLVNETADLLSGLKVSGIEEQILRAQDRLASLQGSKMASESTKAGAKVSTPIWSTKAEFEAVAKPSEAMAARLAGKEIISVRIAESLLKNKDIPAEEKAAIEAVSKRWFGARNEAFTMPKDKFVEEVGAAKQSEFIKTHGVKGDTFAEATQLSKQLKDAQNAFKSLEDLGTKMINARKIAKAETRKPIDFGSEKLNKVAQQLWYGKEAVVPKLARSLGISEQDAYYHYLPDMFDEYQQVNRTSRGGWGMNQSLGKKSTQTEFEAFKKAGGITDVRELVQKRGLQIIDTRIKNSFLKTATKTLGRPLASMSEEEAKKLGFAKFTRVHPWTKEDVGGWFLKPVADELAHIMDSKAKDVPDLIKAYDWTTNLFKASVTTLLPGFHIMNATSSVVQNMIKLGVDAANPRIQKLAYSMATIDMHKMSAKVWRNTHAENLIRDLKGTELVTKTGQKINAYDLYKQIKKEYPDLFHTSQLEKELETGKQVPGWARKLSKAVPFLKPDWKWFRRGMNLSTGIDSQAKMVAIIASVESGKTVTEGIKAAEQTIFNYAKLTPFERDIMRRIIPFYSYARKNLEFQMRMIKEQPGRMAAQFKIFNGLNASFSDMHTSPDSKYAVPSYLLDRLGFMNGKIGSGNATYLSGFNLPIEEFLGRFSGDHGIVWNAVENVLSQANPMIKAPIELTTGVDIFRGKPITEITNPDQFTSMFTAMPGPVGAAFKKVLDYRIIPNQPVYMNNQIVGYRDKAVANPYALWILRNLPTSRLTSVAGKTIGPESPTQTTPRLVSLLTNLNVAVPNTQLEKLMQDRNEYDTIGKWLVQIGVVKEFNTFYIPKKK